MFYKMDFTAVEYVETAGALTCAIALPLVQWQNGPGRREEGESAGLEQRQPGHEQTRNRSAFNKYINITLGLSYTTKSVEIILSQYKKGPGGVNWSYGFSICEEDTELAARNERGGFHTDGNRDDGSHDRDKRLLSPGDG